VVPGLALPWYLLGRVRFTRLDWMRLAMQVQLPETYRHRSQRLHVGAFRRQSRILFGIENLFRKHVVSTSARVLAKPPDPELHAAVFTTNLTLALSRR